MGRWVFSFFVASFFSVSGLWPQQSSPVSEEGLFDLIAQAQEYGAAYSFETESGRLTQLHLERIRRLFVQESRDASADAGMPDIAGLHRPNTRQQFLRGLQWFLETFLHRREVSIEDQLEEFRDLVRRTRTHGGELRRTWVALGLSHFFALSQDTDHHMEPEEIARILRLRRELSAMEAIGYREFDWMKGEQSNNVEGEVLPIEITEDSILRQSRNAYIAWLKQATPLEILESLEIFFSTHHQTMQEPASTEQWRQLRYDILELAIYRFVSSRETNIQDFRNHLEEMYRRIDLPNVEQRIAEVAFRLAFDQGRGATEVFTWEQRRILESLLEKNSDSRDISNEEAAAITRLTFMLVKMEADLMGLPEWLELPRQIRSELESVQPNKWFPVGRVAQEVFNRVLEGFLAVGFFEDSIGEHSGLYRKFLAESSQLYEKILQSDRSDQTSSASVLREDLEDLVLLLFTEELRRRDFRESYQNYWILVGDELMKSIRQSHGSSRLVREGMFNELNKAALLWHLRDLHVKFGDERHLQQALQRTFFEYILTLLTHLPPVSDAMSSTWRLGLAATERRWRDQLESEVKNGVGGLAAIINIFESKTTPPMPPLILERILRSSLKDVKSALLKGNGLPWHLNQSSLQGWPIRLRMVPFSRDLELPHAQLPWVQACLQGLQTFAKGSKGKLIRSPGD